MSKKILSVILSAFLVLSCCSAMLVAFAEEDTSSVNTGENENKSTEDMIHIDESASELISGYAQLLEKEDTMTENEKNRLDVIGNMIFDFGSQISKSVSSEVLAEQYDKIVNAIATISESTKAFVTADGPVGEFEALVNAYSGNVNTKEPTEEDLLGYQEILDAYAKLTDTQKGQIDIIVFDTVFQLVLKREYQLAVMAAAKPSAKTDYAAAEKSAENILGNVGHAAYFNEAKELNSIVNNTKLSAQERLDAFAKASKTARVYSSLWYPSYNAFYYSVLSSTTGKSYVTIAQAYEKEALNADPFSEVSPAKISKPKPADYANGEDDPAYIQAFDAYMDNQKTIAEYNSRKANHTAKYDLEGMSKIADVCPEIKPLVDLIPTAIEAIEAFNADNTNIAPAKRVVAEYEKLNSISKAFIDKNTTVKYRTVTKSSSSSWTTTGQSALDLYRECSDIANYEKLNAFIRVINNINKPYENADITVAKEAYNEVPSSLRSNIPDDIKQKYTEILASIAPDTPSLEKPDLSVFVKTKVDYPLATSHDQVESALPKIENFLTNTVLPAVGVQDGLDGLIKTGLYTNYTVAEICKMLYPAIGELTSLLSVDPAKLAKALTEEKFSGAVSALNACGGDWEQLKFLDGDMGFYDGDREGFTDAVSALFRPLSLLTMALKFENNISQANGTYTYNAYEDLVPIFEALDLEGVMSSHEYTLYVQQVSSENSNMAMDARIRPILVPIFNLLDDIGESPLDTLLNVLPKLGWAIKSGLVNNQIKALCSKIGLVTVNPPELDAAGLYDILAPKLENLTINDTAVSIKLDKDRFIKFIDDIGGCGTAVVNESIARGTAYRLGVESDKADAFTVLFKWLYTELFSDENTESIKSLIDGSDLNFILKFAVKGVIGTLSVTSADSAFAALINFAEPQLPLFTPDDNQGSESGNIIDTVLGGIKDVVEGFFGNEQGDNNSNNSNGNITDVIPNIPNTDTRSGILTASFAVAAGTVGIAAFIKKRNCE